MDRLDILRVFVNVANLGSFAEAARRLRLSPSVVTRAVAALEDELGVMLIVRTTRSLRLSERGEIYLQSCRQILEDYDQATRRVRGENAEPRGEMKVAAPVVFGRLHVLPVVNALLDAHPMLSIHLSLSDRNVHLIEEGVDIAVRIGELADSSLIATKLGAVSRVLVASPAYLARRGRPALLADLSHHDLVAFENMDRRSEWRFGADDRTVRVEPRLVVNSADAAIAAAEAGRGITRALSYQVEAGVRAGRLIVLLQGFAPPALPVSTLYPAGRIASANVAAFIKATRARFSAHPLLPVEEWANLRR
jgi:DNA-binding transcriptional LysR family regulator